MKNNKIIWVIGIIVLILFSFSNGGKKEAADLSRSFSKSTVVHGEQIEVTISEATSGLTLLTETIPSGWTFISSDSGKLDGSKLRAYITTNNFKYKVQAPNSDGIGAFTGIFRSTSNDVGSTGGYKQVVVEAEVLPCTFTDWAPLANTECSGTSFQQSRSISTGPSTCSPLTQSATGTKTTGECEVVTDCSNPFGLNNQYNCINVASDGTILKCTSGNWVIDSTCDGSCETDGEVSSSKSELCAVVGECNNVVDTNNDCQISVSELMTYAKSLIAGQSGFSVSKLMESAKILVNNGGNY